MVSQSSTQPDPSPPQPSEYPPMPDQHLIYEAVPLALPPGEASTPLKRIWELRHRYGFPFPGPISHLVDGPSKHNRDIDYKSMHSAIALCDSALLSRNEILHGKTMFSLARLYRELNTDHKQEEDQLMNLMATTFAESVENGLVSAWCDREYGSRIWETCLPSQGDVLACIFAKNETECDGWWYKMLEGMDKLDFLSLDVYVLGAGDAEEAGLQSQGNNSQGDDQADDQRHIQGLTW